MICFWLHDKTQKDHEVVSPKALFMVFFYLININIRFIKITIET